MTSARGIFWSGFASAVLALVATIVWLFCIPPDDILATFDAPQRGSGPLDSLRQGTELS
jgi:hypothetical protein